jgi:predicted nucleic acid-binding protein
MLIDTDVLVDFLAERKPFTANAKRLIRQTKDKGIKIHAAAHSITNMFYILRKVYPAPKLKQLLLDLCNAISVVEINAALINNVLLNNDFKDIEDCLQAECAKSVRAEYIVTRNIADYSRSPIPAVLPEDILKLINA